MTATPDSTAPQDSAPTPDDAAPVLGEQGRPEPPQAGDETATLRGFLDFQRATFAWRTDGLDAEGLRRRLDGHPSPMTLGGMLKHLAYVEAHWFVTVAHGQPWPHPWADVDWDADRDWDWNSAAEDSPEDLRALWRESVERSEAILERLLGDGPAALDVTHSAHGGRDHVSLRWILTHMVEEYARHNGHADLLREQIDGQTGE